MGQARGQVEKQTLTFFSWGIIGGYAVDIVHPNFPFLQSVSSSSC